MGTAKWRGKEEEEGKTYFAQRGPLEWKAAGASGNKSCATIGRGSLPKYLSCNSLGYKYIIDICRNSCVISYSKQFHTYNTKKFSTLKENFKQLETVTNDLRLYPTLNPW